MKDIIEINDQYLLQMEEKAKREYIPIISREVGQFLSVLLKIKKPVRILEVGTAIGYSTIWMAKAVSPEVEIVTIERDEDRALEAKKNFAHYGFEQQINLKIGDAIEILPYIKRQFDFVFLDAAKGQYPNFLDYILDLLPLEGIIAADNVLYRGLVNNNHRIKHKRRTMVTNLREYLDRIERLSCLDSTVVPIGDGIAVSIRRN